MGGLVASSMLYQSPDLFDERAVLLSPVPTKITANDSRRAGAILGALQYHLGHRLPKVGHKLVTSRRISAVATKLIMTTSDKELKKAIFEHHYKNLDYISDIEFYSKLHHDINRKGSIDYASELQKKQLLLITGNRDNVTPLKYMKRLAEAINPHTFIVIDGVGHLAHYERAPEVAAAIEKFILLP
jgi:pimeloyl-ACP methyl ester carboxylesterase